MAKETIKPNKKGEIKITFIKGGLHASTGTPVGTKIPAKKHEEAKGGKLGAKAKKQEEFAENVLTGRKKGRPKKHRNTADGYMH